MDRIRLPGVAGAMILLAACSGPKATGGEFREGALQAGVSLGAGFGASDSKGRPAHDLALATGHIGWVFTGTVAAETWLRGNWEVLGEVFAGAQFRPNGRYLFGVTPLLRYNFATGSGWMPFVDFGAGVTYTDIGRPNLSTRFQFNDQAGLGAHCFLRQDVAVTVQYRFVHLSNAGMKEPNLGVDAHVFSVGVTRLF